jgi:hypothetical protein
VLRRDSTARSWRRGAHRPGRLILLRAVEAAGAISLAATNASAADKVRITSLSDVGFGTISNLATDAVQSQDVCVFSTSSPERYRVTAAGSGTGGSFLLRSGANSLAYDVQWNDAAGQATGTQLLPNQSLTNQSSNATQQRCNSGPSSSASLIVILRSAALGAATTGTYAGTLTLVVAPE